MSDSLSRRQAAQRILTAGAAGLAFAKISKAGQPQMEEALSNLRAARESLSRATANKGGHRVNAIKMVDQAIDEVKAGISAAS